MKFTMTFNIAEKQFADEETLRRTIYNALVTEAERVWRGGIKSHDIRDRAGLGNAILGRLQVLEEPCLSN